MLSPTGAVGIAIETKVEMRQFELNSDQFNRFEESARILRSEIRGGKHRHITQFEYRMNFSYETELYETKAPFFDSVFLLFDDSATNLKIYLTEPFIEREKDRDRKNWRRIREISRDFFLERPDEVRQIVEELDWKKKLIGIIVVDDKAYFVPQLGRVDEVRSELLGSNLQVPNFLGNSVFSFENYMSRIYEDAIADYLRKIYQYNTTPRYKPEYLQGGEIDVFAEKGLMPKNITICECKLRFNEAPITLQEIKKF